MENNDAQSLDKYAHNILWITGKPEKKAKNEKINNAKISYKVQPTCIVTADF